MCFPLDLLRECFLSIPLFPLIVLIPFFKCILLMVDFVVDILDLNRNRISKESALSSKLHEEWAKDRRPAKTGLLGLLGLLWTGPIVTGNVGVVYLHNKCSHLYDALLTCFCFANNLALYKIKLPCCKSRTCSVNLQRILKQKITLMCKCYQTKYMSFIAFDEDCTTLLEYLGEVGAASKIISAVLINPQPSFPLYTNPTKITLKKRTRISGSYEYLCGNTGELSSKYRGRSVSSPPNPNTFIKWRNEQDSRRSPSIDFTRSVGLPDTLDDVSVPVLWICQDNSDWLPISLFTDTVHFHMITQCSLLTGLQSSITFIKVIHQFFKQPNAQ